MVALMTGVPALGHGRPAGPRGRRRVDRSDPARQLAAARRARRRPTRRRSDRCSSRRTSAPIATRSRRACCHTGRRSPGNATSARAASRCYPETQPLNVFSRIFGGALPPGSEPAAQLLAQKLSVLRLHARGSRAHADAGPGQREGPAGRARRRRSRSSRRSLRQTYASMPNTGVCAKPAMPPTYANTSMAGR